MSNCSHPTSALHVDKLNGTTVCTLCGEVVVDQQMELESIFSRTTQRNAINNVSFSDDDDLHYNHSTINSGTFDHVNSFINTRQLNNSALHLLGRNTSHSSSNNITININSRNSGMMSSKNKNNNNTNSLSRMSIRPMRAIVNTPMPHARPSIEVARRGMLAIARLLEISDDMVEMALAIYKLALNVNAVAGARHVVLCACLYAICRREKTSHVVYDFAAINNESPQNIITQMKHICEATHTDVPVIDISCLLLRFAQQMNLGALLNEVMVCALKILRAMEDDWIACGRRPMGVCAASLLVACYVFNIPRTPEQVCGMVRLTSETIAKRLNEFAATPAAGLTNIDEYTPTELTLPPAFNESSRRSTEEDVNAGLREMSAVYYELVAEAKVSSFATPERCAKWRHFIEKHCELEGIAPSAESLDLSRLSAEAQLRILGLPHTKPIPAEAVMESVKREESKLLLKREPLQPSPSLNSPTTVNSIVNEKMSHNDNMPYEGYSFNPTQNDNSDSNNNIINNNNNNGRGDALPLGKLSNVNFDDPQQFRQLTDKYKELLNNAEVAGLNEDFNMDERDGHVIRNTQHVNYNDTERLRSPMPNEPSIAMFDHYNHNNNNNPFIINSHDDDSIKAAIAELLEDGERRHALPWQFVVLQSAEYEDTTDIIPYIVLDNEERIRRQKIGEVLYKELWARGKPRRKTAFDDLFKGKTATDSTIRRNRRHVITGPVRVEDALERALRGRGAASVHTSQISQLIPGLLQEEDEDDHHVNGDEQVNTVTTTTSTNNNNNNSSNVMTSVTNTNRTHTNELSYHLQHNKDAALIPNGSNNVNKPKFINSNYNNGIRSSSNNNNNNVDDSNDVMMNISDAFEYDNHDVMSVDNVEWE